MIGKWDDFARGVRFVYLELDFTQSYYQLIIKIKRKEEEPSYERKAKFALKDCGRRRQLFNVALKLRLNDLNYTFKYDWLI